MKKLAQTFTQRGFDFTQLERAGDVSIYTKRKSSWPPGKFSYEVIRVRQRKERSFADTTLEASEAFPRSEEWGQFGWTYMDFTHAKAKYDTLIALEAK